MTRGTVSPTADAIWGTLQSPNESDRNMEPANVVDALCAVARGLHGIAAAVDRHAPVPLSARPRVDPFENTLPLTPPVTPRSDYPPANPAEPQFQPLEARMHPMGYGLLCPVCGGYNLHHGMVRVESRPGEDDDGIAVLIVDGKAEILMQDASNLRGRRDALIVSFSCETCGGEDCGELVIQQHKGSTYVRWEAVPTGDAESAP